MAELDPGLRREDKERGIALNHPNASQPYQFFDCYVVFDR
jgi:hypothetical protein